MFTPLICTVIFLLQKSIAENDCQFDKTYRICETIKWTTWSKCTHTCGGGTQKSVNLFCCPSPNSEEQCLTKCNMTKSDINLIAPCAQTCYNGTFNNNTHTCDCFSGYEGYCCENDTDECKNERCGHGKCTNFIGGYTCLCDVGYTGQNCETDIDECISSPCQHGRCQNFINRYNCSCDPGYTDVNCQTDIDECISSPCQHGRCTNYINRYNCSCDPGYTDVNCQADIDECISSPCKHGTCRDHHNGYSCACNNGYTGEHCENAITTTTKILSTTFSPKITLESLLSSSAKTPEVQTMSTNYIKRQTAPIQSNTTWMFNSTLNETVWSKCLGESKFCDHGQCYNSTEGNIICHCDDLFNGDRCDTVKPWIIVIITMVLLAILTIVSLVIWLYFPKVQTTLKGIFKTKHIKVTDSTKHIKSKINTNEELHVIEL